MWLSHSLLVTLTLCSASCLSVPSHSLRAPPPSCGYTSSEPSTPTRTCKRAGSWVASGGPGFTESALFLPCRVLFAYLPPRLTDCTVGGAMLFITTTSGSSASRRCTRRQQHMSSRSLGFKKKKKKNLSGSFCISCPLESHRRLLLFSLPGLLFVHATPFHHHALPSPDGCPPCPISGLTHSFSNP